jgi:hypothetical protein
MAMICKKSISLRLKSIISNEVLNKITENYEKNIMIDNYVIILSSDERKYKCKKYDIIFPIDYNQDNVKIKSSCDNKQFLISTQLRNLILYSNYNQMFFVKSNKDVLDVVINDCITKSKSKSFLYIKTLLYDSSYLSRKYDNNIDVLERNINENIYYKINKYLINKHMIINFIIDMYYGTRTRYGVYGFNKLLLNKIINFF